VSSSVVCGSCKKNDFGPDDRVFEFETFSLCSTCVVLVNQYLSSAGQDQNQSEREFDRDNLSNQNLVPSEIVKILDEDVIKQEGAKKKFAIALFQHIRRISNPKIEYKSNILCIGPTGSGKTELSRAVSKIMQVPMVIVDCSRYSPTGYVGDSPQTMIEQLLAESGYNQALAEKGIIVLDEIDKITTNSGSDQRNLKEGVQQEILKITEGTKVLVRQQQREFVIDTSKILFIASGAFATLPKVMGLEKVKEINLMGPAQIIAEKNEIKWQERVTTKDLKNYGFIPEFLGRFPIVTFTEELSIEDFVQILTKTKKSAINQLSEILLLDGITFEIDPSLLLDIATEAKKSDLGARSLAGVMERYLEPIFMDIEKYRNRHLQITKNEIQIKEITLARGHETVPF